MIMQQISKQNHMLRKSASLILIMAMLVMILLPGGTVWGSSHNTVKFVVGEMSYVNAGVRTTMDVSTFIEDSRTFVPVRFMAQALGVPNDAIGWDGAKQQVTLRKGSTTLIMMIGGKELSVNGKASMMDTAPLIRNSRTFLPARYVAEALGYTVTYEEMTKTVIIAPPGEMVNAVEVKDFAFAPKTLTIKKGESVTWTNRDPVSHSILMNGVDGGLFGTDQSYTQAFPEAGTFNYVCGPHPRMEGTIIVE